MSLRNKSICLSILFVCLFSSSFGVSTQSSVEEQEAKRSKIRQVTKEYDDHEDGKICVSYCFEINITVTSSPSPSVCSLEEQEEIGKLLEQGLLDIFETPTSQRSFRTPELKICPKPINFPTPSPTPAPYTSKWSLPSRYYYHGSLRRRNLSQQAHGNNNSSFFHNDSSSILFSNYTTETNVSIRQERNLREHHKFIPPMYVGGFRCRICNGDDQDRRRRQLFLLSRLSREPPQELIDLIESYTTDLLSIYLHQVIAQGADEKYENHCLRDKVPHALVESKLISCDEMKEMECSDGSPTWGAAVPVDLYTRPGGLCSGCHSGDE